MPGSWNDASRLATVQALVEQHSLAIDKTAFIATGDKVFVNGHFYSDKPPFPSFLGAMVYAPLYAIGVRLTDGPSVACYLITLFTVKLAWLLGVVTFARTLRFTPLGERARIQLTAALGFATLYWSWSSAFNNHELAASLLAIGFYCLVNARYGLVPRLHLFFSGLLFSAAGCCDNPTIIFFALFLVNVFTFSKRKVWVCIYAFPAILTTVPSLAATWAIHQSLVPVQIVKSYFEYEGSQIALSQISGVGVNSAATTAKYATLLLLGPSGFLLYNPFVIIGCVGLAQIIRKRSQLWPEAVAVAIGSAIIFTYYALTTNNFGGYSYSIRWFVPMIPLLTFFAFPIIGDRSIFTRTRFAVVFTISALIASIGLYNPWCATSDSNPPLLSNLTQIAAHAKQLTRRLHEL